MTAANPVRVSTLGRQLPRVEQLRRVGEGVSRTDRRQPVPCERAHVALEAIVGWPIAAHRGLGGGPGAIEEEQHSVVKQIEEARHRWIVGVAKTVARVFGQVQWKRSIGAEQPEEVHREPWRRAIHPFLKLGQGRSREP